MPKKGQYEDITGKKFNRLTALEYAGQGNRRRTYWLCQCDCGNKVKVQTVHLKSGHTTSCGCRLQEVKDNIGNVNYKNGLSQSRLYFAYHNMINRCFRENNYEYSNYGERGITVCDEWKDRTKNGFVNFANWALNNGFKDNLTLDRINVNGNYEPSNCRWVDLLTQANNKRKTRKIKINGQVDTVSNWSRKLNVSYWNLLNYSKGKKNCKYSSLKIEVV